MLQAESGFLGGMAELLGLPPEAIVGVTIDGLSEMLQKGQNGHPFLLCDERAPGDFVARQWLRQARFPGPSQVIVAFPRFEPWRRRFPRASLGLDWDNVFPQPVLRPRPAVSEYRPAAFRPPARKVAWLWPPQPREHPGEPPRPAYRPPAHLPHTG